MSDSSVVESPVVGVVSGLDAAVARLCEVNLTALSDVDCVQLVKQVEVVTRRLQAAGLPVLREVTVRRAFSKAGCSSPSALLTALTRMRPGVAKARVEAMDALTPSVSPSGETIAPRLPETAELLRAGVIGLDHAEVVQKLMGKIPHKVDQELRENTEAALAELCRKYPSSKVETIGERIVEYLDPDGTLADDADRARQRELTLGKQAANLMAKVSGRLDPATGALLEVMLGVWAAKGMNNPDDPLSPVGAADDPVLNPDVLQAAADNDTRSQGQRNHDAIRAMLMCLLESGQLGKSHRGLPVQVIINMTKDQVDQWFREQAENSEAAAGQDAGGTSGTGADEAAPPADPGTDNPIAPDPVDDDSGIDDDVPGSVGEMHWEDRNWLPTLGDSPGQRPFGSGVCYSATGTVLPISDAMKLAVRSDKSFVIFDNHSWQPLYHGRARRLASEAQRLTMFAAHRGCSHPGCSNPALWAEAHHTREWALGGLTDITHLAPACPQHHKLIGPGAHQWQTVMLTDGPDAGRCAWIAPAIVDPDRTPMVNRAHHPDEALDEARLAMQARRKERLAQRKRELGIEPPGPPETPDPPDEDHG